MPASDTIEAKGHLIDSGLLSAIFDKIIEFKASYEILTFDIGRTNDDPSRIEMRINAADTPVLDELLQQLTTFGCHPMRERDATVKPAEKGPVRSGRFLLDHQPSHARAAGGTLDRGRAAADGRGDRGGRRPGRVPAAA